MTSQNFYIGPVIKDGLRKDVKPSAIAEDAFVKLVNALQFRGRIIRRPGYTLLGNLSNQTPVMGLRTQELFALNTQALIAFDTTQAYTYSGGAFINLPSTMPVVWSGTNYQFFYSINYAGAFWATNSKPGLNGRNISAITKAAIGPGTPLVTTSVAHGFTTGQTVVFVNVSGMTEINGLSSKITVQSPTTFSLDQIDTSGFGVYTTGGIALNSQVAITGQDGIRYYALTASGNTWVNYNPPINTTTALMGALLIFAYRGYLVFLNTTEGNEATSQNFPNRARWTQVGTPYYSQPVPITPNIQTVDVKAARDDLFGRGGANDAPTSEAIIGAAFIRDILIVYFERSTWRLRFVNNAQNPFVWERINIELGADSCFSTVPFDKGLMAIGNRGIVMSDANDTVRIDDKIPDDVFNIRQANNGLERVYGIRTFRKRLVFWTIPSTSNAMGTFPDLVLVYNYDTKNWSYFDDTFTCFGYFYPTGTAQTWADMTDSWKSYDLPWNSGIESQGEETIIAGNQQGFIFKLDQTSGENSPSLNISGIASGVVTSTNHNLPDGSWISLSSVVGTTSADGVSLNSRNFKVANPSMNANTFTLTEFKPIAAPNASPGGTELTYSYEIGYTPIVPLSVHIWIGSDEYTDQTGYGIIIGTNGLGTIDYNTGELNITFASAYANTSVNIYIVSYDAEQDIVPVDTTGAFVSGKITKISIMDIQSKYFNFFENNKRTRLSKMDFYIDQTDQGQFTCNIFPDSTDAPANAPLPDNPQSNVVLTTENPYQFGNGEQTIYRLYSDVTGQTFQFQLTLSDQQAAVSNINKAPFELVNLMVNARQGGRLV